MTEQWFLMNAWRKLCGLSASPLSGSKKLPPLKILKKNQWSQEFEKLRNNRMVMGAFRYGLIEEQDFSTYPLIPETMKRINKYKKDRNLEHLVDAANLLMLAFIHGQRQGEKLNMVDDGEHCE